ncbi:hypothetical protein KSA82_20820, partial [Acinetobacter baumannii]|nr:hypothetical protein [Acinetobacter baumannii]
MNQTFKAEDKFDFVINLLTSLDNICFESESNSISGTITKRSPFSFESIHDQLENFEIDTSDNDQSIGKILVPLTGTNIFYDLDHYLKKDSRRLDATPTRSFYIYDQSVKFIPDTDCSNNELNNVFVVANLFLN